MDPGELVVTRWDDQPPFPRFTVVKADPVILVAAEFMEQVAQHQDDCDKLGLEPFASIEFCGEDNTLVGNIFRVGEFTYVVKGFDLQKDAYLCGWPD